MPSPDVSSYVDLTLLDLDPQTIFDNALALAATRIPDWVPLEGNVEVVLLEALSEVVAELVYAINRLPAGITEVLLRLYGLSRDPGLYPTATATVTVADLGGHVIPAGTLLRLDLESGLDPLLLATDVDLPIAAGATTGTVAVTGTDRTADGNGSPAGTALQVVSSIPYIDAAELASGVVGGAGAEGGADFLQRAGARLQQITTTLVLPEQFDAAAAEQPGIQRVKTINDYRSDTSVVALGHVTVAVLGLGGVAVPVGTKNALEALLEGRALASLDVHVADVTVTNVVVAVTVERLADWADADVQASVVNALATWLDPDVWEFSAKVWLNEVISVVDRADGVRRVVGTPTLNGVAADLVLPGVAGVAGVAKAGVPVVTVQPPS